jgi:hypothetical protein
MATCAQRPVYANQLTHEMKFLFSAGLEVLKASDQPPEEDRDESVSGMTLRQVLLTGVEDVVRFDKVFSHYQQHPDGKVTAFFEDGTSATGDVLAAADGSNSRVRRQYLPHARLVDTGLLGITGKTLLTPETRSLLPQRMIEGVSTVHGPKGFMCIFHVMQFKWDTEGELKKRHRAHRRRAHQGLARSAVRQQPRLHHVGLCRGRSLAARGRDKHEGRGDPAPGRGPDRRLASQLSEDLRAG